jgi:hypothetical protein
MLVAIIILTTEYHPQPRFESTLRVRLLYTHSTLSGCAVTNGLEVVLLNLF